MNLPCLGSQVFVMNFLYTKCNHDQNLKAHNRAATSWYVRGRNYCSLMLYLVTKHVFENVGGITRLTPPFGCGPDSQAID